MKEEVYRGSHYSLEGCTMIPQKVWAVLPRTIWDSAIGREKQQSSFLYEDGIMIEQEFSVTAALHSLARTTAYNHGKVIDYKIKDGVVKYCGKQPFLRLPLFPMRPKMGYVSLDDIRELCVAAAGKAMILFPGGHPLLIYMKFVNAAALIKQAHDEIGTVPIFHVLYPTADKMMELYQKGQPLLVPPFAEDFCQLATWRTTEEMRHAVNPDQRAEEILRGRKKMAASSGSSRYVVDLLNGRGASYVPPEEKPEKAAMIMINETEKTEDARDYVSAAIMEMLRAFAASESMQLYCRAMEALYRQWEEPAKQWRDMWKELFSQWEEPAKQWRDMWKELFSQCKEGMQHTA